MKKKLKIIVPIVLLVLFAFLTIGLKTIDVETGPSGTDIGFYHLNAFFLPFDLDYKWDKISNIILALSIFTYFGGTLFFGLLQVIKKKSLKDIDFTIYLYFLLLICTVLFEVLFKAISINYRPLAKETSYPSTHVLFVTVISLGECWSSSRTNSSEKRMFTAIIGKDKVNIIEKIDLLQALAFITLTFLSRFLSMKHWFTDCLGSLILGLLLLSITNLIYSYNEKDNELNA